MRRFTDEWAEKQIRAEIQRLEEEGGVFIAMGYSPEELTIVEYVDGSQQIQPLVKRQED